MAQVVTELTIDARGAEAGGAQFERVLDRAHAKADQVQQASMKMFSSVPQSADRVSLALQKLQASFDPVAKAQFAAEREMVRSMATIDRAVRMGVTTEQQAATIISGLRQKQVRELDAVREAQQRLNATPANQNRGYANDNRYNTANIAAQFQDIAVTSAMGMSPLQIALQQGTQLSAVLGQAGAAGAVRSLGAAFMSLINPVSLATLAVVGLTAAAIQYFSGFLSDSDDSAEALKEQAELISRVATRWGDAVPAIKAYNDEVTKQKDIQEALAAAAALSDQQFTAPRDSIRDITIDVVDLVDKLQTLGAEPDQIVRLQDAFDVLKDRTQEGTVATEDVTRVQEALAALLQSTGLPIIAEYAAQFDELAKEIEKANAAAEKFAVIQEGGVLRNKDGRTSVLSPLNPLDGFNRSPLQTEEEIMFERSRREREAEENKRLGGMVPVPTPRPNIEMEGLPGDEEVNRGADVIRQQQERIEGLRLELELIGQSDDVRAKMITQLRVEQEIRELGIDALGAEAQAIRANAAEITDYTLELEDLAKAQDDVNERAEFFGDLGMGVIDDLTSGADGLEKALKRVVNALADAVLQALLLGQGPLAGFFGTGPASGSGATVGGWIGQLFGGSGAGSAAAATLRSAANDNSSLYAPGAVTRAPLPPIGYGSDLATNIRALASNIGANPRDLAALMSFESGFRPDVWGGAGGRHYGLIQAGGPERTAYGITPGGSLASQFAGIERYFLDRGFKPGMSGLDLYSTVNAGRPGLYNASDARNGGTWGTVADKWNQQMGPHFEKADKLLGDVNNSLGKFGRTTGEATTGIGQLGQAGTQATQGLGTFTSALSQFPAAPGGGAGSLLGGVLSSAFAGSAAYDWLSANPGGFIGLYHAGGIAGSPSQMRSGVDPRLFIGAPRLHGGGIAGDEVPAILRRGEPVFKSLEHARQVVGGGSKVNININNLAGAQVSAEATEQADGTSIDVIVDRVVAEKLSTRGTAANNTVRQQFGARSPLKRR